MADALLKSGSTRASVRAVCLAVSGVNHPNDQQRILNWLGFVILYEMLTYSDLIIFQLKKPNL